MSDKGAKVVSDEENDDVVNSLQAVVVNPRNLMS